MNQILIKILKVLKLYYIDIKIKSEWSPTFGSLITRFDSLISPPSTS
jgi:hypothetical protein